MKAFLFLATVIISFAATASIQFPTGYTRVDDEKMEDYKKALLISIKQNQDVITGCDPRWVNDTFNAVEDILKSDQSSQPLIIFNRYYEVNERLLHRLIFTTDASLKKVVQVDAEIYKMSEINQGDLGNPDFVEDYVLQGKWNCARQP